MRYLLENIDFEDERVITGAAQPQITRRTLSPVKVFLPSLKEQKNIVKKLDSLREQIDPLQQEYTTQLADMDELRQSLLQKAFAGELT